VGLQLLKIAGLVLVGCAAMLFVVWVFQRRLIYLPLDPTVPPAAEVLPLAEEVRFGTADGLSLGAWFVPSRVTPARGTVLVLHGNAGNRAARSPLAEALSRRGFSVLLVDYRGFGGNPGRPTERGLALDARAARDYLLSRDDVDPDRLLYFGESLGAAVALELAVAYPPALLALRSPFTSMTEVARLHYPYLPVRWLLADRYPSLTRIEQLDCPVLVIAGTRDQVVPFDQSRALYDAAPVTDRRLTVVEGAGHNDRQLLDGRAMLDPLDRFWDDLHAEDDVRRWSDE
jgi:fermentation-respiration switch protein FrsA (DUF1100 family)